MTVDHNEHIEPVGIEGGQESEPLVESSHMALRSF